ncbi:hypothetical protein QUF86_08640 [Peribacillus sp. NJ11]|uniref:hypothetical protein n=1 Tax=Peribacillus sp. NJ11 TaxID=3055861 RepID=UPI0025A2026E|nr:hypothetical protein [Peribacillus sp. NJ11]MDM5220816.1 hypothetical protein [Peribacillus sp. NJ11]
MEFKDLFDMKKIQKNEPKKILDAAIKSIFSLGPIQLVGKEMNELAYEMPLKAEFDELSPYILYEKKDGIYKIVVPYFDERKLSEFQVQLFQKNINDCFPERGFYIVGSSELIIKPLGLIKVEMTGIPIIRVGKDIRYTQPSNDIRGRGYRENLYFYYDYDKKEFQRVYSDKLEECRFKMDRNPEIVEEYHESVQEYIKREILLDEIKKRIYRLTISYLPELKSWFKFTYGDGGITIGSLESYLDQYKEFLQETMCNNLKIKLIYSNVTTREYEELINKKRS